MIKKQKHYSKSFKEKAVKLSYQHDNIKDLADEFGIKILNIYRWIDKKQITQQNCDYQGPQDIQP